MKRGLTICYADDDLDDLDFFRDVTQALDSSITLHTHNRGEKLLESLLKPPYPQIIFIDLNMPGKNGFDVLEELKHSAKLKNIPVVIFSTSSDERMVSKCLKLGANLYLRKSSSYDAFKKSIEDTLNINWKTFKPSLSNFIYRNSLVNRPLY